TRLINRHERAEAHRNGGKLPKIGHEPRVRIGRKSAAGLQLAPEVLELLGANPAFDKSARVDARRSMALEINNVSLEFFGARAERQVNAVDRRMSAQALQNLRGHFRTTGLQDGVQ